MEICNQHVNVKENVAKNRRPENIWTNRQISTSPGLEIKTEMVPTKLKCHFSTKYTNLPLKK